MVSLHKFLERIGLSILVNTVDINYKQKRSKITTQYGYYTFIVMIIFLAFIPFRKCVHRFLDHIMGYRIRRRLRSLASRERLMFVNVRVIRYILLLSTILTLLTLLQTHMDVCFIAARLGRVSVYCLPTVLFLTLRPSPLPHTLYLALIPIHKWLSRLIFLQGILHSLLYFIYFVTQGELYKILLFKNLTGVIALFAFLILVLTSLPIVRRWHYRIFFSNHYIQSWFLVIALYFHSRPSIPFITITNVGVLLYQIYYKYKMSALSEIKVHDVSETMSVIEIPNSAIRIKTLIPGAHIRMIDFPTNHLFKCLLNGFFVPEQHPYTLATIESDSVQKLVVKRGDFKLENKARYLITGSYLPHLDFLASTADGGGSINSLAVCAGMKKCLIVVGGSAISFALPILRVLGYNGVIVKIIWVLRNHEDLKVLNYFKNILVNNDSIDIFITGNYTHYEKRQFREIVYDLHRKREKVEANRERQYLSPSLLKENKTNPKKLSPLNISEIENADIVRNYGACKVRSLPENAFNGLESERDPKKFLGGRIHRRGSIISLKEHTRSDESAEHDESTFENVDLEFNGIPLDSQKKQNYCQSDHQYHPDHINQNPDSFSKEPNCLPRLDNSTELIGTCDSSDDITNDSNDTSRKGSLGSEVYDDLSNYWILKGLSCRIEFGRPILGLYYYNWCLSSSCIGPMVDVSSGELLCYDQLNSAAAEEAENNFYKSALFLKHKRARFCDCGGKPDDKIWVISAGPKGLVNKVHLWADECGFRFHEESFSI